MVVIIAIAIAGPPQHSVGGRKTYIVAKLSLSIDYL